MRKQIIVISIFLYFFLSGCSSPFSCENELLFQVNSPDNQYKAVIFTRDCGATTAKSYQISILKIDKEFDNKEKGNLFIAELGSRPLVPIGFAWSSDSLHVHINDPKEIFLQKDSMLNQPVTYTIGDGFDIK